MERIVNIVNFVRASEPRFAIDLEKPVREHLKLLEEFGYPATFLLQYDALIEGEYVEILKNTAVDVEIGGWFEIVKQLTDAAGIDYHSENGWLWDFHTQCSTTAAYTLEERKLLVDRYMEKFKEKFGRYPDSCGAWTLDAYTIAYMKSAYGVKIVCICREQCGTDGLSLWGGYYSKLYYPSKNNILCPAGCEENQIGIPVMRMLGICPVNGYDTRGITTTMEPVAQGGNDEKYVRNYFEETMKKPSLFYNQVQIGQENSFGWSANDCWWDVEHPMVRQYEELKKLCSEVDVRVEKMRDTAKWFTDNFEVTPPTTYNYLSGEAERNSVWYSSKYYRINICMLNKGFYVRDAFLFDDEKKEKYWNETVKSHGTYYMNLPLMDGYNWAEEKKPNSAGLFPVDRSGAEVKYEKFDYSETTDGAILVFKTVKFGNITLRLEESGASCEIEKNVEDFALKCRYEMKCESFEGIQAAFNGDLFVRNIIPDGKLVRYKSVNDEYAIRFDKGCVTDGMIIPEQGQISIKMKNSL